MTALQNSNNVSPKKTDFLSIIAVLSTLVLVSVPIVSIFATPQVDDFGTSAFVYFAAIFILVLGGLDLIVIKNLAKSAKNSQASWLLELFYVIATRGFLLFYLIARHLEYQKYKVKHQNHLIGHWTQRPKSIRIKPTCTN